MGEEYLDLILPSIALFVLVSYFAFSLYRSIRLPLTTSICHEMRFFRNWVDRMLQGDSQQDRGNFMAAINCKISVLNSYGSYSLALCSLTGAWVGDNLFTDYVYGNRNPSIAIVKYISILTFSLAAFVCFKKSADCLVLVSILASMSSAETISRIREEIQAASVLFYLGRRAMYSALTLIAWFFGPIPMFIATLSLVTILYLMDGDTSPDLLDDFHPQPI